MAKIKNTKTELKAQTDALKRYMRFLPMLQLKKQQLQMEIAAITSEINTITANEKAYRDSLGSWVGLFATVSFDSDFVKLVSIDTAEDNIAGVPIPVYKGIKTERAPLNLLTTPPWYDDAQEAIEKAYVFNAKRTILFEQRRLISEELRATSQRVNLFEKVKIPECKENIRIIRIHIGDESTAAVARGKIAKKRTPATITEDNNGDLK